MLKTISLGMLALFMVNHGFGQSQSQMAQSDRDGQFAKVKLTNLPMVVGLFKQADRSTGRLWVALDKEEEQWEEIELGQIRAIFLLQGSREKLLNYLVGGTVGGIVGFSGLLAEKKIFNKQPNQEVFQDPTEAIIYVSTGTMAGFLWGYLRGRGKDVRLWSVYNREFVSTTPDRPGKRDLRDQENIFRIPAGAVIQVIMDPPRE